MENAPAVFGFSHILAAALMAALGMFMLKVSKKSRRVAFRLGALCIVGMVLGLAVSYLIAHILTPLIILTYGGVSKTGEMMYRFMFWAIFLGLNMLLVISGGLSGILYGRKIEEEKIDKDK